MRKLFLVISLFLLLVWVSARSGWTQNAVYPLMTSTWEVFSWPLNAYYPAADPDDYGTVNGHVGNACGPTAIAKLLHYHRHPVNGSGTHSLTDYLGRFYEADFENTYYEWAEMKNYLPENASEEEYGPVATLMLHAYVMMEDPDHTGHNLEYICQMLKKYMRYSDDAYVAYRFDYTRQEYIDLLKGELDAGRPLLIESWTENSAPPGEEGNHEGHYWNIDGYNERDEFHVIWNGDNYHRWFDIDDINDDFQDVHAYYIWALIDAKPDESQKVVELTSPQSGYLFKKDQTIDITWDSQNIDHLDIDFSYDGETWVEIATDLDATLGRYTWTGPETETKNASLRFQDVENSGYAFVFPGFEVFDQEEVVLVSPRNDEIYQAGTDLCFGWTYEGVYDILLEYKGSNEQDWTVIAQDQPANQQFYTWDIPFQSGREFDVRLCNADRSLISAAQSIRIASSEQVGGPYLADLNSVLLMHYDRNLEDAANDLDIILEGEHLTWEMGPPGKGAAIYLDNHARSDHHSLVIPNEDYLNFRGSFTVDFWFKVKSWDLGFINKPVILIKPISSNYGNYALEGDATQDCVHFKVRTSAGTQVVSSTSGTVVPGRWYHVAMIHDVENRSLTLLLHNDQKERIDQTELTYDQGVTISTGGGDLLVGRGESTGDHFDGTIDELRISRVVREFNASWSGVESPDRLKGIRVFPNPVSSCITIDLQDITSSEVQITLMDLQGRVVKTSRIPTGLIQYSLDMVNINNGLYWLVVEAESQQFRNKIVKLR